jgi:hypothetical protein
VGIHEWGHEWDHELVTPSTCRYESEGSQAKATGGMELDVVEPYSITRSSSRNLCGLAYETHHLDPSRHAGACWLVPRSDFRQSMVKISRKNQIKSRFLQISRRSADFDLNQRAGRSSFILGLG